MPSLPRFHASVTQVLFTCCLTLLSDTRHAHPSRATTCGQATLVRTAGHGWLWTRYGLSRSSWLSRSTLF